MSLSPQAPTRPLAAIEFTISSTFALLEIAGGMLGLINNVGEISLTIKPLCTLHYTFGGVEFKLEVNNELHT
ncbi:hypothetical protein [Pseudomonas shirazensis]|uniref:hypothetical protein n=1 Tax=Pseudomonas shirazensis TaxID=2745494 RepID=UPI003D2D55EF